MARPTKLDPSVQQIICAAIRRGLSYEQAATVAGIDYATLRRWRLRGEAEVERVSKNSRASVRASEKPFCEFCEALQRALAEGENTNADIVNEAARGGHTVTKTEFKQVKHWDAVGGGFVVTEEQTVTKTETTLPDWRAAAFVLERRHPERWGRRDKTELSGPGGGPIKTEDVSLTDEERLERISRLLNKGRASGT